MPAANSVRCGRSGNVEFIVDDADHESRLDYSCNPIMVSLLHDFNIMDPFTRFDFDFISDDFTDCKIDFAFARNVAICIADAYHRVHPTRNSRYAPILQL